VSIGGVVQVIVLAEREAAGRVIEAANSHCSPERAIIP
jgi:hypothetical protein